MLRLAEVVMNNPSVDILYITFNRLAYTRQTLPPMLENAGADFRLTLVDNGSTDGTVDYLKAFVRRHAKRIAAVRFLDHNVGISKPTNDFWHASCADFLGKVDNDTLCPPGWLARLLDAHKQSRRLGVIGGFHFHPDYVDMDGLEQRVIEVDGVRLVPDAFIGGCCYLFRRQVQRQWGRLAVGPFKTQGWTEYQSNLCRHGYVNGYLWPLLLVRHFDDPLDPNNLAMTAHLENSKISMGEKGIALDRKSLLAWYAEDAARVVSGVSLKNLLAQSRRMVQESSATATPLLPETSPSSEGNAS